MDSQPSYSQQKQFARLFLPSWAELGGLTVISLILLFVGAFTSIKESLGISSDTLGGNLDLPGGFSGLLKIISQSSVLPALATALFWAGVGGFVYIVVWLIGNAVIAVRNDVVVIENYIKPEHNSAVPAAWQEFVESLILRLSGLAAILGFSVLTISVLLPLWLRLFHDGIVHWNQSLPFAQGMLSWFGLALMLHIYVVLLRLILLRVRIFD